MIGIWATMFVVGGYMLYREIKECETKPINELRSKFNPKNLF